MNGRCQGFYCGAAVLALVADETDTDPAVLARVTP